MKTTPDDPAQLPGATEEIVPAEGVGPGQISPIGETKGRLLAAGPPACWDCLPEQLQRAGTALPLLEEMNL